MMGPFMRMKHVCLLIAGVLLVSGVSAEENDWSIPNLNQLKEITVTLHPYSWHGTFYPDGSALLTGGIGNSVRAVAPKGRISFKKTYALLVPHLRPVQEINYKTGEDTKFLFVGFFAEDKANSASFYIRDKEPMRTLMYGLRDKVVPINDAFSSKAKFESFLTNHPLVPGDKPAPVVYATCYDSFKVTRTAKTDSTALENLYGSLEEEQNQHWEMPPSLLSNLVARGVNLNPAPAAEETQGAVTKAGDRNLTGILAPSTRPWRLYSGILAVLCAGVAFWFMRRKR